MPTTCGFPNCRFRSRYRGAEDNRHFYRVPKKPAILRKKWLEAIGRTEETIVSQLRVCSGHFYGGEKHEGDVPVADPAVDEPIRVELPPKISRFSSTVNKRNSYGTRGGGGVGRGRGLHHTQGIRNKMCFLKSGMLNYMTKHNNCLNLLGSFKPKHTLASNSTQSSPTLRNDHKIRSNKPIHLNATNIINHNNDSNNPLTWFNNLYSPHIYDYLKTISLNTSTSSLSELNTSKKYLYDPRKHFNSTSISKDQSILQNYSHQSPQQINYPINKYTSLIHTSRCYTPLTSTTIGLTNLIQNEDSILKKSSSSPFNNNNNNNNNGNINSINNIINDNKPQSAFSSVTSTFNNHNNNNDINISKDFIDNNDYVMKSSFLSNKEQFSLNITTDNINKNKFQSTMSIPFKSNQSINYYLSLATIMNDVLTKKLTDTYINSSKYPSHIEHYQTHLKDEYNPLNIMNPINEFNEIKDLSIKSEYIKEYSNIMKFYTKKSNEFSPLNHYEQNSMETIDDKMKDNGNYMKMNNCDQFEQQNEIVHCNSLQLKEERSNQLEDIPSLNQIVQYVIFIGIDELTVEMPILHDVINPLCIQYSDIKNLPEHIRQNVSDMVTYQEIVLSVEYLQYFSFLKNIYIPECLNSKNCWDELKNLGINLHIVPLELDVNKSADFIIGIILSTYYDIMSIYMNEKNQPTVKRPASSPSQSIVNQLVQINKPLHNHTNDIIFKHTTTTNDQAIGNIVSNNQGTRLNTERNIQIGIIGLGPISLTIIRQLEKFNYNIRVFDKFLPDGIDTVLNFNYTNNYEEIIHRSDWIIFIQESSIMKDMRSFGRSNGCSLLTVNEIFNENMKAKMKSGCHILYINLVDDYPHELITLNTLAHSGYAADIYVLLRKSCENLTSEFNIQKSPNLICLNNKLNRLQVQSEELRRSISQFLRRNLLKNLMFIPKFTEITQTDEFKNKTEPRHKMTLNNQKMNPTINTLKKNTNTHQKLPPHGIKKHLTFGINSLVASKTLKYYPTHCG
uniref:THAP-type domain-containing protein n=1 Tax=Schistosoma mansoni TaxID=6183 RepID=A0A5K4F713_SCHMA